MISNPFTDVFHDHKQYAWGFEIEKWGKLKNLFFLSHYIWWSILEENVANISNFTQFNWIYLVINMSAFEVMFEFMKLRII